MEFFEQQDESRRHTVYLGFMTVVGSVAVAISGGAMAVFLVLMHRKQDPATIDQADWLQLGTVMAAGALAVICLTVLFRRWQLGRSADAVPRRLGATPIPEDTAGTEYRQLENVVAEIALAAQIPVPKLLVLESESGIDAFAAGLSSQQASITVSRGCLERLDRDELQAVVAHEFSHIVNDDIALNLRFACLTSGLAVFWTTAKWIIKLAVRIPPVRGKLPVLLLSTILTSPLWFMGTVGVLFCRLMKAGIPRQREYLADACAVQYTREVDGLLGALRKALQLRPSRSSGMSSDLVSHMLFVGKRRGWFAPLATHPRIEDRIELIENGFRD